jgi:glycosyltransferase involved in cell wall biosynthesis
LKVSDLTVLVVGLARNCEQTLSRDINRIALALGGVSSVHWFVVESDSEDESIRVLQELQGKRDNFRHVSLGQLRDEIPLRTDRLAHCRNVYLREFRENPLYSNVDLVIIADLDGINVRLTRRGFESCFLRDDWGACFANQAGPYYDIWALRHPLWSPNDCWEQYAFLNKIVDKPFRNRRASVYSKMIRIPQTSSWIQVNSAFGGLGIYKARILGSAEYPTATADTQCEHVVFHQKLVDQGHSLFINPSLVNAGFTEHSWKGIALVWWAKKTRRKIRRFVSGVKRWVLIRGITSE